LAHGVDTDAARFGRIVFEDTIVVAFRGIKRALQVSVHADRGGITLPGADLALGVARARPAWAAFEARRNQLLLAATAEHEDEQTRRERSRVHPPAYKRAGEIGDLRSTLVATRCHSPGAEPTMHVIFIEPRFPANQREFIRALHEVGAEITAIGEGSKDTLDHDMRRWLLHYEEVKNVTNEDELMRAVRFIQSKKYVDRLEASVEAHIMPVANVREACKIPGTSVRTAFLCRDKPAMKEALREAGIPCAQSAAAENADEIRAFVKSVGYPIIIKPRAAAGASGTSKIDDDAELERVLPTLHGSVAVEEFIEGHEGFYDTLSIDGEVAHEFVCHYYPNVLEAMRTRWISPQFISTNRIDQATSYNEVKALGRKVIKALGIETSATHMEWFYGPKGLKFSEIGCRPPGVRAWDLYNVGNDMDLYREWAHAIVHKRPFTKPSRRFSAGIIALRPDKDGVISHYDGLDAVQQAFGPWIIDAHLPNPGTPTQPVGSGYMGNAWIRLKHPDYDELRRMMDRVGETVRVRAR
jgi:formate-dependent phosphoribosylglycinamide formyltransferase (GAR transformylase)